MAVSREIHLVRRPSGVPSPEDFALVEANVGEPGEGQVEVEAVLLSVDPYMRSRLHDQPFDVPMIGTGIARVVRSRAPGLAEGSLVRHGGGMRERFVAEARTLRPLDPDPALPLTVYMHALGGTGLTAYGGLLQVGALQDGEQVLVSTAAGAVGSVVAQIAKIKRCYVVGTAGSDDKVAWLRDVAGIDAAINYKTQPLAEAVAAATPNGIDVYFENVGGAHLDAALARMNTHGRIPVCGMISTYNGGGDGVRNLSRMIYGKVRMEGFVASDFGHLNDRFVEDMTGWLKDGRVKYQETVVDGFENTVDAFIGLFAGANAGKMIVRCG